MRFLSRIFFYLGILLANLIIGNSGSTKVNSNSTEVVVEQIAPNKESVKINDDQTKESNL